MLFALVAVIVAMFIVPKDSLAISIISLIFFLELVISVYVLELQDQMLARVGTLMIGLLSCTRSIVAILQVTLPGWADHTLAIIEALFILLVLILMIGEIFESHIAIYKKMFASIAGYLLLGLLFSIIYGQIYMLDEGKITIEYSDSEEVKFSDLVYFSFTTLTTMGIGDIVPIGYIAKLLAATQAVIGQLYLVTVISRLIAKA